MQLPSGTLDHFRAFSGQMVGVFGGSFSDKEDHMSNDCPTPEGSAGDTPTAL
jgi:hypothetical protein